MTPTTKRIPGFGSILRGARLGWGWSARNGCFIRMCDTSAGIVIELCPNGSIPSKKTPTGSHRCWWDNSSILDEIPWLKAVRAVHKYIRVMVNDDGTIKP